MIVAKSEVDICPTELVDWLCDLCVLISRRYRNRFEYVVQNARQITYLFVELDKGWLKLSLDVLSCEVVGELVVRVRLASIGLGGTVVS